MSKTDPLTDRALARPSTSPSDFPPTRRVPRIRPSSIARGTAAASFACACLLAGAACSIALGNPAPTELPRMAAMAGALACALALIGLGALLALRMHDLRKREAHLITRVERVRRELDALGLTPREAAIAELILQHRSYADIAACCRLSPRTVQFHASNIFRKAFVTQRRQFEHLILVEGLQSEDAAYERIPRIIRPEGSGER